MKSGVRWALAFLLLIVSGSNYAALNDEKTRWDRYFKRKLSDPPANYISEIIKRLPSDREDKKAIDLGSGVGHETMLLLKKGYQVISVDSQYAAFQCMNTLPGFEEYERKVTPIVSTFEKLNFSEMPTVDLMLANCSLPFIPKKEFARVWKQVVSAIKPGGYFIVSLFDPDYAIFDEKRRSNMTFHTKEEAIKLLKGFKIINIKEINNPSANPGKNNHYYIFFAKKV